MCLKDCVSFAPVQRGARVAIQLFANSLRLSQPSPLGLEIYNGGIEAEAEKNCGALIFHEKRDTLISHLKSGTSGWAARLDNENWTNDESQCTVIDNKAKVPPLFLSWPAIGTGPWHHIAIIQRQEVGYIKSNRLKRPTIKWFIGGTV